VGPAPADKDGVLNSCVLLLAAGIPAGLAAGAAGWVVRLRRRLARQGRELCGHAAQLATLQRRYDRLVDNVPDFLFTCDQEGRLTSVNAACARWAGYTREESLQLRLDQMVAPGHHMRVQEALAELAGRPGPVAFEFEMLSKDNRRLWVEVVANRMASPGQPAGILGLGRDIAERKAAQEALRESERQLTAILDSCPFGAHFYELRAGGRLVLTGSTASANRLLKLDCRHFVGQTIEEAFPFLESAGIAAAGRQIAAAGGTFFQERVKVKREGFAGAFEIHAFQTGPQRMAVLFRATSEWHRADQHPLVIDRQAVAPEVPAREDDLAQVLASFRPASPVNKIEETSGFPENPGGRETIMVVEDEPAVGHILEVALQQYGYRVVRAASGRAALGLWPDHGGQVDLLLTDMVMPEGIGGAELAARLQQERPALRIIYTSGYNTEMTLGTRLLPPGTRFLPKPYPPSRLAAVVRECLDEPLCNPAESVGPHLESYN
jgi:PAS domain S-box-containing protein